jgi:serine/threonine protein phosphatase PrpC
LRRRAEKRAKLADEGDDSQAVAAAAESLVETAPLVRSRTLPLDVPAAPLCRQCWTPCALDGETTKCPVCQGVVHSSCFAEQCRVCKVLLRLPMLLYGGTLVCGSTKKSLAVDVAGLSVAVTTGPACEVFERNLARLTQDGAGDGMHPLCVLNDAACVAWDGDRAENQDVGFCPLPEAVIKIFCVFDGHGVGGQTAAQFSASDLIRRCVLHRLLLPDLSDTEAAAASMKQAFTETQAALLELLQVQQLECGSTVVMAQLVGEKLVVANVGDSRAVLVRQLDDEWTPQPLSLDHSFSRADECKRIQETSKGEIVIGAGNMMRVMPGGGFPREEIKRRALALNMTRAIGHPVLSQYGVSPEPEFSTTAVAPGDRLVLGSDGLWDVVENDEVALLCSYRSSASKCAQALLNIARDKYSRNRQQHGRADNTTIIVGYVAALGEPSPPLSQPEA